MRASCRLWMSTARPFPNSIGRPHCSVRWAATPRRTSARQEGSVLPSSAPRHCTPAIVSTCWSTVTPPTTRWRMRSTARIRACISRSTSSLTTPWGGGSPSGSCGVRGAVCRSGSCSMRWAVAARGAGWCRCLRMPGSRCGCSIRCTSSRPGAAGAAIIASCSSSTGGWRSPAASTSRRATPAAAAPACLHAGRCAAAGATPMFSCRARRCARSMRRSCCAGSSSGLGRRRRKRYQGQHQHQRLRRRRATGATRP